MGNKNKSFGNGSIIGKGTIAVDYWYDDKQPLLHFLSHLHADHIDGLNKSWNFPIFTSELNCKLAPKFISGINTNLLVPLKLNKEHALPLGPDIKLLVTLIEANHVPGAVLFLFRGFFGNVLYTGDFRFSQDMLKTSALETILNREDLDVLYLDNTFFYPTCNFKSRSEVSQRLVAFLKQHPR
jgi:DNA cross-link repair 1B protein